MNLLVTGGCGFIGSNFVRRHHQRYPNDRLVVLDALTYAGNLQNLEDIRGQFRFVHGDIGDRALVDSILGDESIDAVVHFAAESHVDRSITGPLAFVHTNVVGTATLLEASRRAAKVPRFLHVSTDEVYGDLGPTDPAFTEDTPLAPRSPYAATKAASDHLVLSYAHTYKFPAMVSRCSNNYGPYQFPEKLLPLMILNAMADQPLPVYGTGDNVRDWIHVFDHCDGLDLILEKGTLGRVYNLGGLCERKNLDMVHEILRALGKPSSLIRFVTDRPGHDRRYAMNIERAHKELGFSPRYLLSDGLAETISWYKGQTVWCQQVKSGEYRTWYERNYGHRLNEADK